MHLPALTCLTYIYDTLESSKKKIIFFSNYENIFNKCEVNIYLILMNLYTYYHKHLNEIPHIINHQRINHYIFLK